MRCLLVAAFAACTGSGEPASDATPPPDARFCKASAGNCAEVPLVLDGTWTITAVHSVTGPPGPALGDISFQLTFTPTADEGCYDAVATDVPAGVGPNWPDPNGTWLTDGFSAVSNKEIMGASSLLVVSWSYCTIAANGRLQVSASSSIRTTTPQPGLHPLELVTGTATQP